MNQEPTMTQSAHGTKSWWLHGKLHRKDGPAVEYAHGTKYWYLHGALHRENAPAIEGADGSKMWWLHGKQHRMDGPAFEYANGDKSWYLHGHLYRNAEAWAEALLTQCNKPHDASDVNAFLKQILKQNIEHAL